MIAKSLQNHFLDQTPIGYTENALHPGPGITSLADVSTLPLEICVGNDIYEFQG